jgi:hypothetical protein
VGLGNLVTGHFSGKFFSKVSTSGHAGSNDTGLNVLSCPGAEPVKVKTNKQIFLNIIISECRNLFIPNFPEY